VADVSWEEANSFCRWLTAELAANNHRPPTTDHRRPAVASRTYGEGALITDDQLSSVVHRPSPVVFRLPTEAEWEHAARGSGGSIFPWGDAWDEGRAVTRESGRGATMPVGAIAAGASAYGCLDMAGNVWEWTASLDKPYPYVPDDGREDLASGGRRILRGGSYANPHGFARCACRFRLPPTAHNEFLGFRLAYSV
jgi:formylglycine-generating enzyme required for sulfatase activity